MKTATAMVIAILVVIGFAWFIWTWGFCRFYVDADHLAVIIAKEGDDMPPEQILAKEGQKGVRENVLGEGRYFYNPYLYEHEIHPVTMIAPGKVGLVTAKVGAELPAKEFLAAAGQKGIWRRVLGPGKYRLNPYGYAIDVIDAVTIPIGYIGVVTSLSGAEAPAGEFAGPNQMGIRAQVLQPGLYYANPKEYKIDVVEIGVNQVSLLGKLGTAVTTKGYIAAKNPELNEMYRNVIAGQQEKRAEQMRQDQENQPAANAEQMQRLQTRVRQENKPMAQPLAPNAPPQTAQLQADLSPTFVLSQFVEFPSRDGFEISLDMTVEFELLPADIAGIFRDYGDLPQVVRNIIMPQILSISRLKGSAYRATDFIIGEGREKFQTEVTEALKRTMDEKKIKVHNALIRHVEVPNQILDPIQQASVAKEQDLTNKEKQNTARKQAQLNTEQSLVEQSRETVAQETTKLVAELRADQEKEVARIQAETLKQVAAVRQQVAGLQAEKTKKLGQADADTTRMVEGEKANGFQLKVAAFGEPEAYSLWEFARALNDQVRINLIHAGPGTLWTDLQKASLGDLGGAAKLQEKAPGK